MADEILNSLRKIGLKFNDLSLLKTAFTHRSYLNEFKDAKESNERLEFLGDVVLSFIVSSTLFKLRLKDNEGDLTNLRSYIVKTSSLAEASRKLNLGKYLRLSRGEESGGGRTSTQLLANTFEAFLGALFLDQGIEAAKKLVDSVLLPSFQKELQSGPPKDNKSALQEIVQEKTKRSPIYKIIRSLGPDHARRFLVGVYIGGKEMGRGEGHSKQIAEEEAAEKALIKITNS